MIYLSAVPLPDSALLLHHAPRLVASVPPLDLFGFAVVLSIFLLIVPLPGFGSSFQFSFTFAA
jgi:hypothetical protein